LFVFVELRKSETAKPYNGHTGFQV